MKTHCRHEGSKSFSRRRKSYWMLLLLCARAHAFVGQCRGAWHCSLKTSGQSVLTVKATKRISEGKRAVKVQMPDDTSTTKSGEEVLKKKRRKTRRKANPASRLLGFGLYEHELLTPVEEQRLGKKIRKAIQTKEMIATIIEEKHVQRFEALVKEQEYQRRISAPSLMDEMSNGNEEEEDNEYLEDLSIIGLDVQSLKEVKRNLKDLSHIKIQPADETGDYLWTDVYRSPEEDDADSVILSDVDIKTKLGLSGGREEVSRILIEGAMARDKLIRSNVRLVLGIARKWCQNVQYTTTNANDLAKLYIGTWARPSLDEAFQEGIIGLATAADRFDYTRKLKFGTYATYWITNSIRNCFEKATTGCLRVPNNYYRIRQHYHKLVKKHYDTSGGKRLDIDVAASDLGLDAKRLGLILRTTEPLVSLDSKVPNGLSPTQSGKGGVFQEYDPDAVLANNIKW